MKEKGRMSDVIVVGVTEAIGLIKKGFGFIQPVSKNNERIDFTVAV